MPKKIKVRSKKRIKAFGEVFTPMRLCREMIRKALKDDDGKKTVLEPSFGNGNFILAILHERLQCSKVSNLPHEALQTIYGVELQQDNVEEAHERILNYVRLWCKKYVLFPDSQTGLINGKDVDTVFEERGVELMKDTRFLFGGDLESYLSKVKAILQYNLVQGDILAMDLNGPWPGVIPK